MVNMAWNKFNIFSFFYSCVYFHDRRHWHVTVGPPYTLRLKVKFYSSEPNTLREELTRYQFFLQLKQDLLEGRLHSKTTDHSPTFSFDEKCAELCALALQCEYTHTHTIVCVSTFFLSLSFRLASHHISSHRRFSKCVKKTEFD